MERKIMDNIHSIIFKSNFFLIDENVNQYLLSPKNYYISLFVYVVGGLVFLLNYYQYKESFLFGFIVGSLLSFYMLIYCPLIYYANKKVAEGLILDIEQKNDGIDLYLYHHYITKKTHINKYEIIDDWKPYFLQFKLYIYIFNDERKYNLLRIENVKYYTIKDLDTMCCYLICVDNDRYIKALEKNREETSQIS